eukprot:NODE_17746_length_927_cov_6.145000.p1 GENE.NODE_17746_length_927_cov_6.145000~~NODE_17746_length_927_cov_6.145000.p1  ORF type:complete len:274 (+),score=41.85 NODE_17746_length_927_cov_6.145000:3-824(+)
MEVAASRHERTRAAMLRDLMKRREEAIARRPADALWDLNPDKLMDLAQFDPAHCSFAATDATDAEVRARRETHRVNMHTNFEEERRQLERRISAVEDVTRQEKAEHDARIARLRAKLKVARDKRHRKAKILAARSPNAGTVGARARGASERGRRALPPGSALLHSSGQVGPVEGQSATSSLKPRPPPDDGNNEVRQWGQLMVTQLGVTQCPTRPHKWTAFTDRTKQWGPPRIADSVEDAFPSTLSSGSVITVTDSLAHWDPRANLSLTSVQTD